MSNWILTALVLVLFNRKGSFSHDVCKKFFVFLLLES